VGFDCTGPHKKKVDRKVPLARNEIRNKPGETAHPRRYEICWDSRARQKKGNGYRRKKTSNSQPVQTGLGLLYQRRRAAIQPPMDLSSARRRGQGAGGGRWRRGWGKGSRAILWKGGHEKLGRGGREVMGGGVAVGTGGAVITLLPPLVSWIYNESRAGLWRGPGLADKRGEGGLVI
jgi:hypothetical protein